jgi:hypothetical protein
VHRRSDACRNCLFTGLWRQRYELAESDGVVAVLANCPANSVAWMSDTMSHNDTKRISLIFHLDEAALHLKELANDIATGRLTPVNGPIHFRRDLLSTKPGGNRCGAIVNRRRSEV